MVARCYLKIINKKKKKWKKTKKNCKKCENTVVYFKSRYVIIILFYYIKLLLF